MAVRRPRAGRRGCRGRRVETRGDAWRRCRSGGSVAAPSPFSAVPVMPPRRRKLRRSTREQAQTRKKPGNARRGTRHPPRSNRVAGRPGGALLCSPVGADPARHPRCAGRMTARTERRPGERRQAKKLQLLLPPTHRELVNAVTKREDSKRRLRAAPARRAASWRAAARPAEASRTACGWRRDTVARRVAA